ncbi:acyltransferase family protein [Yanshouia hominis]|uniref:Acyltransferase n=1 Tax=Yanshouia hominis TaxID=2763673 RepID=A0ABR7NM51_9FIRM|nr:acyltransferase family protein [Yanshouia hominis]MBC8577488.1 acyltransferase [Yanshouia hominis]
MIKRNNVIDFAKFIFSVVILLNHSNSLMPGKGCFMFGGYLAVEFFFLVSGFLIAQSSAKKSSFDANTIGTETLRLVLNKFKRIFPYYSLGFVLSFAVTQYINHVSGRSILKNAIKSILTFLRLGTTVGLNSYEVMDLCWYISGMLLGIMIIYPLLRYHANLFCYVEAPLICAFIYGYLFHTYKGTATLDWIGICNTGLLRGIAGLSLGCLTYEGSRKIKNIKWSGNGRVFLTLVEVMGYFIALIHMQFKSKIGSDDFVIIGILTMSISISFSGSSLSYKMFGQTNVPWAEYSLALYMGHWPVLLFIANDHALSTFQLKFVTYFVCSFIVSFLLQKGGNLLKNLFGWIGKEAKSLFVLP